MVMQRRSLSQLSNENGSPSSLNKPLTKIGQTGTVYCKPGCCKKTRIAQNIDSVEESVLSQQNAPGTHKTEIFKTSLQRNVKQE